MTQFKILSTKTLAPSFKEEAKQKGIELTEMEFVNIQSIFTKEKHEEVLSRITSTDTKAVVFTSQHAVVNTKLHFEAHDTYGISSQWKIFCLGGATKDAVRERLFVDHVAATGNSATELASTIIEDDSIKRVVFFCGNNRRDELPDLLKKSGIEVVEVIVYETIETPSVTTGDLDAILFFSPSGVKSFFSLNTLPKKTTCFAIGPTTADSIGEHTDNLVITSEKPTQEIMMAAVWRYFQNINVNE
jgi:uroporphyrinogen-III synthase